MDWGSFAGNVADQFGRIRYGVPTSEKERLAREGNLPGAPDPAQGVEEADRYASGFLSGQTWPAASDIIQPLVDRVKTSDLPFFGGDDPELQSYASEGSRRGSRMDPLLFQLLMGGR